MIQKMKNMKIKKKIKKKKLIINLVKPIKCVLIKTGKLEFMRARLTIQQNKPSLCLIAEMILVTPQKANIPILKFQKTIKVLFFHWIFCKFLKCYFYFKVIRFVSFQQVSSGCKIKKFKR